MSRRPSKKPEQEEESGVSDNSEAPAPESLDSVVMEGLASSPVAETTGLEAASPSPPDSESEVDSLRRERDELSDALLRRRADFENYRRRVERDRHTAAQEALSSLFHELLGTVDNLERALSASGGEDELRQGVELTYRELVGLLESHDVVAVDPSGQRFDPSLHQALLHEPVPGLEEGEVAEVFRKGYSFGERLLRPALVKVAKGDESEDVPEGEDE